MASLSSLWTAAGRSASVTRPEPNDGSGSHQADDLPAHNDAPRVLRPAHSYSAQDRSRLTAMMSHGSTPSMENGGGRGGVARGPCSWVGRQQHLAEGERRGQPVR